MTDLAKTPFVRELASSDKKIRDKATDSLALFLRSKTDLSLLELLKLWKGLFFCFYHSDRPLTQQALARNLSYTLVPTLPRSTIHDFLRAFWITIGREWHGIDRLRLDKYLFLIRSYVGVAFQVFLRQNGPASQSNGAGAGGKRKREESGKTKKRSKGKKSKRDEKSDDETEQQTSTPASGDWTDLKSYLDILANGPLHPLNFDPSQPKPDEANGVIPMPHGPDGLRYHILDVYIDELEKALEVDPETKKSKALGDVEISAELGELLLAPIERLRKESAHRPVRERAGETLSDERLVEWGLREAKAEKEEDSESEEESEEEWGGFGDD
ncbi:ribosomal RNA processing 1 family protein [Aspergillus stella-maris]|uniref:ribosomal RNA processing 1 family protein n=1 Tax=Aspergillus stella-maris TaxID=1810926 RepID=UPI003CCCEAC4